ncbi:hypothetical protein NEOLEDRAFT_56532 [Neolentinus lepideus HHB14362 ss-1]|uniref:DUF6534 domain-containing protein n=1 Tax=Neolentinus lepideus HHB14362 ss-1 TaxID=1314782 RepID=A0A165U755_9AGAM|nr:hypothetical protein NEOLEDRAFT_56532 [Neolentinus lepideus HHB14362 ss-1]
MFALIKLHLIVSTYMGSSIRRCVSCCLAAGKLSTVHRWLCRAMTKLFTDVSSFRWLLYGSFSGAVVADSMIAATLCVLLRRHRTSYRNTNSVIAALIMYSIETCTLTSACSIACLVTVRVLSRLVNTALSMRLCRSVCHYAPQFCLSGRLLYSDQMCANQLMMNTINPDVLFEFGTVVYALFAHLYARKQLKDIGSTYQTVHLSKLPQANMGTDTGTSTD